MASEKVEDHTMQVRCVGDGLVAKPSFIHLNFSLPCDFDFVSCTANDEHRFHYSHSFQCGQPPGVNQSQAGMAYLTYSPRTPQGARISRKQYHGTSDLVVVPDVWFRVYVARKVKVVLLCVSRGQVQV